MSHSDDCRCWDCVSGSAQRPPSGENVQPDRPGWPLLEKTRENADYWLRGGRNEPNREQAILALEQSINAWKGAAYSLAEKMTTGSADFAQGYVAGCKASAYAVSASAATVQHFPLTEIAVKNLADWMNDGDGGLQEVTLHVDAEGGLSVSITDYPEEGAMPLYEPTQRTESAAPLPDDFQDGDCPHCGHENGGHYSDCKTVVPARRAEVAPIVTDDPLFYYVRLTGDSMYCQRKQPLRASDDPLTSAEEIIILLCKTLRGAGPEQR